MPLRSGYMQTPGLETSPLGEDEAPSVQATLRSEQPALGVFDRLKQLFRSPAVMPDRGMGVISGKPYTGATTGRPRESADPIAIRG